MSRHYSVVIPAYNEEKGIGHVIERILSVGKQTGVAFEIIVVDDYSTDATRDIAGRYPVRVVRNVQNFGYGYSVKQGILAASEADIVITDADGTYPVEALPELMREYERGFDMVVGARQGKHYRGSFLKYPARLLFLWLSEFAAGRRIPDINSGLRIFKKPLALRYFHTFSSGFSFTTTITLAFMLNAHSIGYVPIAYDARIGKSKVRYFRDTLRSGQIIVESILFYNPIKIYLLCAFLIGLGALAAAVLSLFLPVKIIGTLLFGYTFAILAFCIGLVTVYLRFMSKARE